MRTTRLRDGDRKMWRIRPEGERPKFIVAGQVYLREFDCLLGIILLYFYSSKGIWIRLESVGRFFASLKLINASAREALMSCSRPLLHPVPNEEFLKGLLSYIFIQSTFWAYLFPTE